MKNSKGKGAAGLLILLAALVGFIYLAYLTVSQNKIKLGLDLAGGVSITYQTVDPTKKIILIKRYKNGNKRKRRKE